MSGAVRVALLPDGVRGWLADAVIAGGGRLVDTGDAEVLVWSVPDDADALAEVLDTRPGIRWVQLPWAGIEKQVHVVQSHPDLTWTCAKGVYAEPVAELALTLLLAGMRGLDRFARATTWERPRGRNLLGSKVVVAGGGGITESFLRLVQPFACDVTVVRQRPRPMPGALSVIAPDALDRVLPSADALVLALPLTPETDGFVDRHRLALLPEHAWVVNVARGRHIRTDDLVAALTSGGIAGAGLDVTDPEPLPDGHPLWTMPNVLLTPHVGNTPEMAVPLLSVRITENLRRWRAGDPLLGPVDATLGY